VALCLSGHRSITAGRTLVRNGFPKVFQLKGGMAAWAQYKGDAKPRE
jgi:rhodanese-related sulfurtransferase